MPSLQLWLATTGRRLRRGRARSPPPGVHSSGRAGPYVGPLHLSAPAPSASAGGGQPRPGSASGA